MKKKHSNQFFEISIMATYCKIKLVIFIVKLHNLQRKPTKQLLLLHIYTNFKLNREKIQVSRRIIKPVEFNFHNLFIFFFFLFIFQPVWEKEMITKSNRIWEREVKKRKEGREKKYRMQVDQRLLRKEIRLQYCPFLIKIGKHTIFDINGQRSLLKE